MEDVYFTCILLQPNAYNYLNTYYKSKNTWFLFSFISKTPFVQDEISDFNINSPFNRKNYGVSFTFGEFATSFV